MGVGRGYDIFPRTFLARLLLALAFLGGLGIVVGGIAFFIIVSSDVLTRIEITFENRTSTELTIYVDEEAEAVIAPRETEIISDLKLLWRVDRLVEAVNPSGAVLFAADLNKDDLEQMEYRIVIEAGDLLSEPPCYGSDLDRCLEEQTDLQAIARDSCDGSERRVCIAPLGKVSPSLVEHLVDHYADEYGLAVTVLSPSAIPHDMVDPSREQIDAPTLIEYMETLFLDAYRDPNAVLIGLTPVDVYDKSRAWRFAFGIRGTFADPKGVISTFRMNPETFGEPQDDDLLFSRARKLISKYIGLLYYDLPPSDDPESPMYDSILSLDDLDKMKEPLPVPGNP